MTIPVTIEIESRALQAVLDELIRRGQDMSPVLHAIGSTLENRTRARFESKTDPDGKAWAPWAESTRKQYAKADKGSRKGSLLDRAGHMLDSLSYQVEGDGVRLGVNVPYGAIHQFGGDIQKAAQSRLVRHRTDAKGNLMHSEHLGGKGLIFAKDSHKRAVARWFEQGAHDVHIPARPFLPIVGSALAHDDEQAILDLVRSYFGKPL